jgi:hypothetical protein
MDIGYVIYIDKCRYEIQEQKEVPVWYICIYRPTSSTAVWLKMSEVLMYFYLQILVKYLLMYHCFILRL